MSENTRRVLDLLAQGKVTVDEAEKLLNAIGPEPGAQPAASRTDNGAPAKPRYIRINVHKAATDHHGDKDVNIRVPIAIVRSGMRIGAMIPGLAGERMHAHLRERGVDVDLSKIDPAMIESLLNDLGEVNIDVDSGRGGKAQVRITCE
jgi:hypothetical protein